MSNISQQSPTVKTKIIPKEVTFTSVFDPPRHTILDRDGNSALIPTDEVEVMHMSFMIEPFMLCSPMEFRSFLHKYSSSENSEIDSDYNIVDDCMKEHYEYITETIGSQKNMRIIELLQDLLKEYGTIVEFILTVVGNHSIKFRYFSDGTLMNKKMSYSDLYRIELMLLPKPGDRTIEYGNRVDSHIRSMLPLYKRKQLSLGVFSCFQSHTIDKFSYLHDHKGFIIEHDPDGPYNERPPIGIGLWYESIVY